MKSRFQGMRALATRLAAGATLAFMGAAALAEDLSGQPTPGGIDLQPGVTVSATSDQGDTVQVTLEE